ncbi:MAG TPA: ATP-binding cassette domain-containing protein [Solirubrobacterales bacterium]|nr:ATP-binding cassette domain-containing protein [Solirubrobacterales bacterium]
MAAQESPNGGGAAGVASAPVLRLEGMHKHFGGVVALNDVSLELRAAEVTAIVGDNGAGKSTLMKIIAGVHQPDEGQIWVGDEQVTFADPRKSRAHGIEVVYQDLALVENQPVFMNMFLGRELRNRVGLLDKRGMKAATQQILSELDIRVHSPSMTVRNLSGGQRQGIAIGRATHWAKQVILMDEPTAALGVQETAKVERTIMRLRERGLSVLIVSHDLDQVFRVADRVYVLRRGRMVGERRIAETDGDQVVAMITGLDRSGAREDAR